MTGYTAFTITWVGVLALVGIGELAGVVGKREGNLVFAVVALGFAAPLNLFVLDSPIWGAVLVALGVSFLWRWRACRNADRIVVTVEEMEITG